MGRHRWGSTALNICRIVTSSSFQISTLLIMLIVCSPLKVSSTFLCPKVMKLEDQILEKVPYGKPGRFLVRFRGQPNEWYVIEEMHAKTPPAPPPPLPRPKPPKPASTKTKAKTKTSKTRAHPRRLYGATDDDEEVDPSTRRKTSSSATKASSRRRAVAATS